MEIYKNTSPAVVTIESPLNPDTGDVIRAVRGGTVLHEFNPALDTVNVGMNLSLTLPLKLVLESQSFSIHWDLAVDGDRFRFVTDVDIVSPILPLPEVMEITGALTREAAVPAERRVRYIIESVTNSRFYPYTAAVPVSTKGSNVLLLPDRLLQLHSLSFSSYFYPVENIIIGDRTITIDPDKWLTIKSDYEGIPGHPGQQVVWNPYRHNAFSSNITYLVNGLWGYATTPPAVQEAARLLLKDYGCNENLWRQRGLEAITVGDSRFQYGERTFSGTGNLDADRLLSDYRKSDIFII